MELRNNLTSEHPWEVHEERFDAEQIVTTGSNFLTGNGYLGYRGTFSDDRAAQFAACVVSDTYDNADGKWTELCTVPNGLFWEVEIGEEALRWREQLVGSAAYRRGLDYRYGEWFAHAATRHALEIRDERFADYADIHRVLSRRTVTVSQPVRLRIRSGLDGELWNLNGEHVGNYTVVEPTEQWPAAMGGRTGEHAIEICVAHHTRVLLRSGSDGGASVIAPTDVERGERTWFALFDLELAAGDSVSFECVMAVYTSNDLRCADSHNPRLAIGAQEVYQAAALSVQGAVAAGFEACRDAHRAVWDARWTDADVRIEGNLLAQRLMRFNLYHAIIATPLHTDHLPIGARGLSCQAYQGAAFWDQEIFNLPMFLFTDPETARRLLIYRHRTLDGARRKARALGYQGAFYAWVSADTGDEICPSYFFKDVLSGRRIRNHFNDWQIHISPDIAYTVWRYMSVTADTSFLRDYGAEIVFEVARFLASRVHYRRDLKRYEILRVLGPDEYHENVDNNFFTNFQARFALQYAAEVFDWMERHESAALAVLRTSLGVSEVERDEWVEIATDLFVPQPRETDGLIEQFQGFWDHEDITPQRLKERLLNPGEYWGWPNGIAVETQVSKQADVTQLFMLHPDAFSKQVMRANWEYYEPRTQHGSSLSPAVYAIVAAWVGHVEEARRYFETATTVDLYNTNKAVSGGTFIGGIHTAACGVAWQIAVSGFAGMRPTRSGFAFDPHLPADWTALEFSLRRWGARLAVRIMRESGCADPEHVPPVIDVMADGSNECALEVAFGPERVQVAPGQRVRLSGIGQDPALDPR